RRLDTGWFTSLLKSAEKYGIIAIVSSFQPCFCVEEIDRAAAIPVVHTVVQIEGAAINSSGTFKFESRHNLVGNRDTIVRNIRPDANAGTVQVIDIDAVGS